MNAIPKPRKRVRPTTAEAAVAVGELASQNATLRKLVAAYKRALIAGIGAGLSIGFIMGRFVA